MKPSPGDMVRITKNASELSGSYVLGYAIEGCTAKALSWQEYCDEVNRLEAKTDFEDLKRWMERTGKHFTFILLTDSPAPPGTRVEGADFTCIGERGALVLLKEDEFEIIESKEAGNT